MGSHGPNVHPVLEVVASHEPLVGQASSLLAAVSVHGPWARPSDEGTFHAPERRAPARLVSKPVLQRAESEFGAPMVIQASNLPRRHSFLPP